MVAYTVTGSFLARRGYWQPFILDRAAENEGRARERVLSEIGSCHHVKRGLIRIDAVAPHAT